MYWEDGLTPGALQSTPIVVNRVPPYMESADCMCFPLSEVYLNVF